MAQEKIQLEGDGAILDDGLWSFIPSEESLNEATKRHRENLDID